jgi:hypothetical protein
MNFAKNFVSALNNALGFAVIKDDETIDEATARLEAMPTQKHNDVEMDGIKSSLHDVTESFNKLSAKVTETETAQKSDNTTLLTMMAEMKGEIDSLKTEITELKKDSLPKPIVNNSIVGTTATNNLTNVITLSKGRFSNN